MKAEKAEKAERVRVEKLDKMFKTKVEKPEKPPDRKAEKHSDRKVVKKAGGRRHATFELTPPTVHRPSLARKKIDDNPKTGMFGSKMVGSKAARRESVQQAAAGGTASKMLRRSARQAADCIPSSPSSECEEESPSSECEEEILLCKKRKRVVELATKLAHGGDPLALMEQLRDETRPRIRAI